MKLWREARGRHSLPYAPTNEADLMEWIGAYADNALNYLTQFPAVFGSGAKYPLTVIRTTWQDLQMVRPFLMAVCDYTASLNAFKNIVLYARELGRDLAAPEELVFPAGMTTNSKIGLLGMIDWQVRLLREQPGFNQVIAEPGTWALIAGGLGVLALLRRRRV